jgi:glycosyltransferase involved in cell wall biosynthesis
LTAIAYIANEFPSPLEPYVVDEIIELRRRGVDVICCSGKRVPPSDVADLRLVERSFREEIHFFQPLSDSELLRAARRLTADRDRLWQVLRPLLRERETSPLRRLRTLGHTVMGAAMAEKLGRFNVNHIHAHHGYFASWMALTAARLLGIGFSFTLHGSDLLQRADLLKAKLDACRFCITVSEFNRRHILQNYPNTPPDKVIVHRLGVDRVLPWPTPPAQADSLPGKFCMVSVGRLHRVKNHGFLLQACALLRDRGLNFICWIIGEGPERPALESLVTKLRLQGRVCLAGHLPRTDLAAYYRYSDLIVMTSESEGIPVVLMEAMAHEKLVLAPAITGIPELVEHQRTGFLYQEGSLADFVSAVTWIQAHQNSLAAVKRAAAASIAASYDRQRNLTTFANSFMASIAQSEATHAHSVLQQVRLSV